MTITFHRPASSRHYLPDDSSNCHSDTFAREAVFEEFYSHDARALDYANFVDRTPQEVALLEKGPHAHD